MNRITEYFLAHILSPLFTRYDPCFVPSDLMAQIRNGFIGIKTQHLDEHCGLFRTVLSHYHPNNIVVNPILFLKFLKARGLLFINFHFFGLNHYLNYLLVFHWLLRLVIGNNTLVYESRPYI